MNKMRPSYKQTEVGVLPEHWDVISLNTSCEFITKGTTPTTYGHGWQSAGILFLRSECVSERGLDLSQSMFVSADAHQMMQRSEVRNGDLLITITGNVGRVVRYFGPEPANLNQHIARVRVNSPKLHDTFAYFYLSQPRVRQHYNQITTGQAYPQLSLVQVRNTALPLPPFPEQQAIAGALGDADALIDALEKLIAKKRTIKLSAMQDLLIGHRRLPEFEGEWTTAPMGDLFDFGRTVPLSRAQLSQEGDVKYVHYGDIHTRLHNHLDFQRTPTPGADRLLCGSATALKIGDWVFADASEDYDGVAKAVEITRLPLDRGAVAGLHTFVLRERGQAFAPGFKGYLANASTFRAQVMRAATGMKVFGISKSQMKSIELSFPPTLDEQRAIAAVLSDMDAEIAALEKKLVTTRAVKQGMMQVLLTGEIRLT